MKTLVQITVKRVKRGHGPWWYGKHAGQVFSVRQDIDYPDLWMVAKGPHKGLTIYQSDTDVVGTVTKTEDPKVFTVPNSDIDLGKLANAENTVDELMNSKFLDEEIKKGLRTAYVTLLLVQKCHRDNQVEHLHAEPVEPHWRGTVTRVSGLIEHACIHGTGHPDHESAKAVARKFRHKASTWLTHGCCGCCRRDDFPGKPKPKKKKE